MPVLAQREVPTSADAAAAVGCGSPEHADGSSPADGHLVQAELLVEEISIDGMCGVY